VRRYYTGLFYVLPTVRLHRLCLFISILIYIAVMKPVQFQGDSLKRCSGEIDEA
jgi:hypothetical protein